MGTRRRAVVEANIPGVLLGDFESDQKTPASARRQFERRPVMVNAFVHRHDRFQHVRIVDYSRGGMQLDGTFGLMPRDSIEVELVSGVRIDAKVMWSLGGRTGVAFREPLAADHPAMIALSRRARPAAETILL